LDTHIRRRIRADAAIVFELAAAVQDWPRILPHYRSVRVLATDGPAKRTVAMAARRDVLPGLAFPLRWTAIQVVDPQSRRIEFEHVRGITRGMRVTWTIERGGADDSVLAEIRHVFEPHWPAPDALVRAIVGEYFVNGVARRTLRRIGELAEARSSLLHPHKKQA
jgi:ribosome-associated toxin RatA of RatAB toxin-antitoxin module